MAVVLNGTTNDITVNGVSVATDAEVTSAVAPLATTAYVDGKMVIGIKVNSTSGTSIDFTGIPSWAKRITVMFNGVSTNGGSNLLLQLGSGSITTTGYIASASTVASAVATTTTTSGLIVEGGNSHIATDTLSGSIVLTLLASNTWTSLGVLGRNTANTVLSGGSVTLSGLLDRIRITTVNGTDTFDAGSINIMYEG